MVEDTEVKRRGRKRRGKKEEGGEKEEKRRGKTVRALSGGRGCGRVMRAPKQPPGAKSRMARPARKRQNTG